MGGENNAFLLFHGESNLVVLYRSCQGGSNGQGLISDSFIAGGLVYLQYQGRI